MSFAVKNALFNRREMPSFCSVPPEPDECDERDRPRSDLETELHSVSNDPLRALTTAAAPPAAAHTSRDSADLDTDYLAFAAIRLPTTTTTTTTATTTIDRHSANKYISDKYTFDKYTSGPYASDQYWIDSHYDIEPVADNTLFDTLVAADHCSPPMKFTSSSACPNSSQRPAPMRHAATMGSLPRSRGGFLHPADVFTTPLMTELDMLTAALASTSVPSTPALPTAMFGAYDSYLNTPASALAPFASPSVYAAPASGQLQDTASLLFAPLDEVRGKDAAMRVDSADLIMDQLASADPAVRQSLVHALVDYISPTTAYQPVCGSRGPSATPMLSPSTMAVDESQASLVDSLVSLLCSPMAASTSAPAAAAAVPAGASTASPAMLELFSPVQAPADVFCTPMLPAMDAVDANNDDVPLAVAAVKRKRDEAGSAAGEDADVPAAQRARADSRQFHCDICNRGFSRQYNMRTHRLTHSPHSTAARPHQCAHCPRTFTRKHDLERHQVLHDSTGAFACDVCGRAFARADVLNRHIGAVHKDA